MQRMSNGWDAYKRGVKKATPGRKAKPKPGVAAKRPGATRDLPRGGTKPAGSASRRPMPGRRPMTGRKPGMR